MNRIRHGKERGRTELDWLDSWHSFSFGHYRDPHYDQFGALRVLNEDRIAAGGGFPMHPHRDMEILTVVWEGQLEHRDSLGHHDVIEQGQLQYMSAGSGILHSEFNPSQEQPTHIHQIWLLPTETGLQPRYDKVELEEGSETLELLAGEEGSGAPISLRADARLYRGRLEAGEQVRLPELSGRRFWLQVHDGALEGEDAWLQSGDALVLDQASDSVLSAASESRFLLFAV